MEKIKVNMSPNPLDVQTIHASQSDGEARQWGFDLHNNGDVIDSSGITEQMVFKSYKGGTEEILPTNGSVPTTAPFVGDIQYPDATRNDQEFTYRQSPTESDGLAKITDVKGNTLVWNQLVEKGNMTDGWTFSNSTGSYSNNVLTFTASAENGFVRPDSPQNIIANHKYLGIIDIKGVSSFATYIYFTGDNGSHFNVNVTTNWQTVARVFTNPNTTSNWYPRIFDARQSGWDAISIRNCMLIDLTQMGLDITEPSDFTSLFPLSYYSYNQGSLLSFNGNGIKTVGKNLFDINDFVKGSLTISDGILSGTAGQFNSELNPRNNNGIPVTFWDNDVTISFDVWTDGNTSTSGSGLIFVLGMSDGSVENATVFLNSQTTKTRTTYSYIASQRAKRIKSIGFSYASQGANIWYIENLQIEFSATETSYEPYTSSTLSLPISTYFPTGMKSAGSVYDELTESKVITRIGSVDLGSLNWTYQSSSENMYVDNVVSNRKNNLGFNAICSKYQQVNEDTISGVSSLTQDKSFAFQYSFNGRIIVRDTSYTDATVFKQAMADQNVKLYYELATPTETSFSTASLVTENAEIPLSNEDGTLIGKCTEQLSENPGFIDAKIKLSDSDGACYSNKIQLHIERSPQ